CKHKNYLNRV
ncbi:guanylyl transferase CofC like family protein, partial [Vibrio parahaemolyticus V-223/04]